MHEMQNRMKIAFCVKQPLPSSLLADEGDPTHARIYGGGQGARVPPKFLKFL